MLVPSTALVSPVTSITHDTSVLATPSVSFDPPARSPAFATRATSVPFALPFSSTPPPPRPQLHHFRHTLPQQPPALFPSRRRHVPRRHPKLPHRPQRHRLR